MVVFLTVPPTVPWAEWKRSMSCFDQGLRHSLEAMIHAALRQLHVGVDTTLLPIEILATQDGRHRKVVATRDIPTGSVMTPVTASNAVRIMSASSHPHAV